MIATKQVLVAKSATSLRSLIGASVNLKRSGQGWAGLCPFHNERTPSFQVYDDHFFCFGCGAHGDAIDWIRRIDGLSFQAAVTALIAVAPVMRPQTAPRPQPYKLDKFAAAAAQIWRESLPAKASPVETYLNFRGVGLPTAPVLRFHPHCPRGKNDRLPAMVALMTDPVTNQPTGVHRTFLKPDGRGKADVEEPKMMLGRARMVRLVDDEEIGEGLGIAEGIETALAVTQVIGWGPVWATCGRTGMAAFPVLPQTTLSIFADSGSPGIEAAKACAARWDQSGAEVWIHIPPPNASDWLDATLSEDR